MQLQYMILYIEASYTNILTTNIDIDFKIVY